MTLATNLLGTFSGWISLLFFFFFSIRRSRWRFSVPCYHAVLVPRFFVPFSSITIVNLIMSWGRLNILHIHVCSLIMRIFLTRNVSTCVGNIILMYIANINYEEISKCVRNIHINGNNRIFSEIYGLFLLIDCVQHLCYV